MKNINKLKINPDYGTLLGDEVNPTLKFENVYGEMMIDTKLKNKVVLISGMDSK